MFVVLGKSDGVVIAIRIGETDAGLNTADWVRRFVCFVVKFSKLTTNTRKRGANSESAILVRLLALTATRKFR